MKSCSGGGAAMEMEPGGPIAKKRKLAAADINGVTTAPAATEAPDLRPPTTAERSQEPPLDRISNLCDTVLGEIITLLPTKEGARTQLLSSRCRHLWRTAPLNLDCGEALVGGILSAHQGSGRRICLPAPYYKFHADADSWLRSPCLDNLQELEFYQGPYRPYPLPTPTPPPAAFRFSSTLRVATFSQCHLVDDTIETLRFAQLRKLALVAAGISERSLYNIIAVGCPVLETLLLNDCWHVDRLRIKSPTLISIGIQSRISELIIEDAPSLQRLIHFEKHMEMQVTVVSAPKLETLGYITEMSEQLKIVFGSTVIQGLRIDSLTTVVCTVKILAINLDSLDLDMVVDMMRCFPCMQKLYIKIAKPGGKRLRPRKHRNLFRSLDIHLKTLVLGCYRATQAQVKLVTFVVLNAGALESVKLEVEPRSYNEGFFAKQHKRLQMKKRASKDAHLCFTTNCGHNASSKFHLSDLDLADPFACAC